MSEPAPERRPWENSRLRFIAGGPDDPRRGFAECITCNRSDLHYLKAVNIWISGNGQSHTGHELELFPEAVEEPRGGPESPSELQESFNEKAPSVAARCTVDGWIFEAHDKRLGPFSVKEMSNPDFDSEIARQLGVEPKEIFLSKQRDYQREIALDELNEILSTTVKYDEPVKAITFLGMLLAQTEEDQYNIAFQAESSTGKSYIPLELAEYFPRSERRTYAGASPTSFYHEVGEWRLLSEVSKGTDLTGLFDLTEQTDKKRKVILVDLEAKILTFMDQPHWMLMEKLRPLLSHDMKLLRYTITDKTGRGGLRAKTVIIKGYPTVVFATAKPTQEDQERTRMWLLSPEASQKKIEESLKLLGARVGHREAFKEWIKGHPQRRWLKERIRFIRGSGTRNIILPEWSKILDRFLAQRPHLSPRAQRDWPRLLYLIKGFALLNCFQRVKAGDHAIIADQKDVDAGSALYESVARSNELGLSPETLRIYEEVILPLDQGGQGVSKREIIMRFRELYGRPLGSKRLSDDVLPALESVGLVAVERNPEDKREMRVYCTIEGRISPSPNNAPPNSAVLQERIQGGIEWLSKPENLDADGWAALDKFTEAVGRDETVQLMLRDGLIELHPTQLNKVRLLRR